MKNLAILSSLLICFTLNLFASAPENIVVDAEWLKTKIKSNNIVLLHMGKIEDYEKEHIAQAHHYVESTNGTKPPICGFR